MRNSFFLKSLYPVDAHTCLYLYQIILTTLFGVNKSSLNSTLITSYLLFKEFQVVIRVSSFINNPAFSTFMYLDFFIRVLMFLNFSAIFI